MLKLYTFQMSTFSEKLRWVLDLEGLSYREQPLLPGLHLHTTKKLAPCSSVPLLVDETTGNGQGERYTKALYGAGQGPDECDGGGKLGLMGVSTKAFRGAALHSGQIAERF